MAVQHADAAVEGGGVGLCVTGRRGARRPRRRCCSCARELPVLAPLTAPGDPPAHSRGGASSSKSKPASLTNLFFGPRDHPYFRENSSGGTHRSLGPLLPLPLLLLLRAPSAEAEARTGWRKQ